jgi:hypothetical protein
MSKGDIARIHEQTARAEIIQRVGLRDNALVLYLGAVSALVGFAGSANAGTEILLIIPYLAFGATTIIEHHHMMIGVLSHYLAVDLDAEYRKLKEYVPQWDNSASAREAYVKRPYFIRRKFGHWVLIAMPSLLSLVVNYQYIWLRSILTAAWWLGFILTILSIVTIAQSSAYRIALRSSEPRN